MDPIIGYRDFVDGRRRTVCLADEGSQYVVDGADTVFGFWIRTDEVLEESPLIVDRK
jgi:hypothetical protein